ncbi:MAG TPA: hypothetical protein VE843_15765 [Ktedonobacteraceae bacterium]|nr:hypothetical protein [Ktedonobacteraceae bacterium]
MSDRIPTLADLCSAIAEGSIVATLEGSMYTVNALELRRYLNTFRSLPTISSTRQTALSSLTESSNWSATVQTTIF